jgi:hypothetical protein
MYNRAKHHPNRTDEMEDAMKIYAVWLKDYKKKRLIEDKKYPILPLEKVKQYEKLAEEYQVSEVARGLKKGVKTDKGFLQMYKYVKGKAHKLQYIPVKEGKVDGQDYWSYRITFINSRLGQMRKAKTPFFYTDGKYKDMPTKQHIILIMHGYSPYTNKI